MRIGVLTATVLMAFGFAWPVLAADDPLAALEGSELDARSNGKRPKQAADPLAAMVPVKPSVGMSAKLPAAAADELPPSFNTGAVLPPVAPNHRPGGGLAPSPAGGGWLTPTAPTPPTLPAFMNPTSPLWNMGD